MRKTLTGLLGTAIISTCLIGCDYGKKDTPSQPPQIPQSQQKEPQKTIYTIENKDGSVLGYFNENNRANLQGLENAGQVEDYRINPITGEVYRLTDQSHEVIALKQTERPFAELKQPQEPEKPAQPEYITRQDMDNHYLPKIAETVQDVIDERFKAYGLEELPSQHQEYQQQGMELPMVPIEPSFSSNSKTRN